MKRYHYILSPWALALMFCLASCTYEIDNPVIPAGPEADAYVFDDEMDQSVSPGDDFYRYVVGSWIDRTPYDDLQWQGTLATQARKGREWITGILNADSPDPVVADLFHRVATADADAASDIALLHAKTDAIAALTTREEVLTEMGRLMRQGYAPGLLTGFGGNAEALILSFFSAYFSEYDELGWWLEQMNYSAEESERLLTLADDFIWYDTQTDGYEKAPGTRHRSTSRRIKNLLYWTKAENVRKAIPYLKSKICTRSAAGTSAGELLIAGLGVDPEYIVLADEETEAVLENIEAYAASDEGLEQLKAVMQLAVIKRDAPYIAISTEEELADLLTYDYYPLIYQLNQLYVAQNVTDADRDNVTRMCEEFRSAFAERIRRIDWMNDATKHRALQKLQAMHILVGYPDRQDSRLILSPTPAKGSLYEELASLYEQFSILTFTYLPGSGQFDNVVTLWLSEEKTWDANARYYTNFNMINLFASNLIPPGCDSSLGEAYNYAVLGAATIGHEITHGFDVDGSYYDEMGRYTDWWSPTDRAAFEEKKQQLIDHFCFYEALPGRHLNGENTVNEDIADLGGLETALEILTNHCRQAGFSSEALDEETRVFLLSFAQAWKSNDSEKADFIDYLLNYDEHSPDKWRVNAQVNNLDVWYRLFNVTSTQYLYVAPSERVHIW